MDWKQYQMLNEIDKKEIIEECYACHMRVYRENMYHVHTGHAVVWKCKNRAMCDHRVDMLKRSVKDMHGKVL